MYGLASWKPIKRRLSNLWTAGITNTCHTLIPGVSSMSTKVLKHIFRSSFVDFCGSVHVRGCIGVAICWRTFKAATFDILFTIFLLLGGNAVVSETKQTTSISNATIHYGIKLFISHLQMSFYVHNVTKWYKDVPYSCVCLILEMAWPQFSTNNNKLTYNIYLHSFDINTITK